MRNRRKRPVIDGLEARFCMDANAPEYVDCSEPAPDPPNDPDPEPDPSEPVPDPGQIPYIPLPPAPIEPAGPGEGDELW